MDLADYMPSLEHVVRVPASKPVLRCAGAYDVVAASDESCPRLFGDSLTVQSMRDDADINILMDRYGVTGKMPEDIRVPVADDFSDVSNFHSAMNSVVDARDEFMRMPAQVRARFDNDPQKLMDFCADGRNIEEARRLGLAKPEDPAIITAREEAVRAKDRAVQEALEEARIAKIVAKLQR